jgi:hypothetical protein
MGYSFRVAAALVAFFATVSLHSRRQCSVVVTFLLAVATLLATRALAEKHPTSAELLARLTHVSQINSLTSDGMKPWLLKANFQRFDNRGKLIEQGTVVEWWIAEEQKRIEVTEGGATQTFVYTQGHEFHAAGADGLPDAVDLLFPALINPVDSINKKQIASKVPHTPNDCILLAWPDAPSPSAGYCLTSEDALQSGTSVAALVATRSSLKVFQDHFVPAKIDIGDKQGTLYSLQLTDLGIVPASSVNLSTADLFENPDPLVPRGTVLPTAKEIKQPSLPEVSPGLSAMVVLRIFVGRDGRARRVDLLYSRDEKYGNEVADAFRKWELEPAIYAGNPIQRDMTITISVNTSVMQLEMPFVR